MNERLKQLRSALNITLEEFGKKVGITRSAVGRLEKGERNLTEQMIISICREFKVNESWFRTGKGSMFLELPEEDASAALVASMLDPNKDAFYDIIIEIMKGYQALSPKSKQAINELADNILKDLASKKEG